MSAGVQVGTQRPTSAPAFAHEKPFGQVVMHSPKAVSLPFAPMTAPLHPTVEAGF